MNSTHSMRTVAIFDAPDNALNWACAQITNPEWFEGGLMDGDPLMMLDMDDGYSYRPTDDIKQCECMIDEHISAMSRFDDRWQVTSKQGATVVSKTLTKACVMAFLSDHFGQVIEVPAELFRSENQPSVNLL